MAERVVKLEETYPSNSHKARAERKAKEEIKIEKVTKGKISKKQKGLFSRMRDDFGGDDARSVGQYILYDVFIPAFKDLIFDIIRGGTERALFGESSRDSNRVTRDRGRSYVSYSSIYNRDRKDNRRRYTERTRLEEDIIFETREDAEIVLERLLDLIEEFDQASVADLYSLVGVSAAYTDNRWGWDNIARASVRGNARSGYYLDMPNPIPLD